MNERTEALAARVEALVGEGRLVRRPAVSVDLSYDVAATDLVAVLTQLRDSPETRFEMLMDVSGIDYLDYGRDEWRTNSASSTGFSRGVNRAGHGGSHAGRRFAASYQLLSIEKNERLTLRCFCSDNEEPALPSVTGVHPGANWFEREAFDLFGIVFHGHPDLRRILTDYGFIGHPFRKDFPLSGHVEVRYDEVRGRVVYEPVDITPRTLVPRVIRDDNRYAPSLKDRNG
jgi:NADH-quinone oxidoreductase subunit C